MRFVTVLITALLTGVGDFCAKHYSLDAGAKWGLAALLAYGVSGIFWLKMVSQFQNLAQAGLIWVLATTIPLMFISQVCFSEPLTITQWCGVGLGIVAFFLLL